MKTRILFAAAGMLIAGSLTAAERLNVLFIAIDDLRPDLACYGNELAVTPNLDRLAASGMVFQRAYCQQAVCAPSRASIMTGARPDTTKVWDLVTHHRAAMPTEPTLGEHFKNHGYISQGIGKIYHGGFDDPPTWSAPWLNPPAQPYALEENLALTRRTEPDRQVAEDGANRSAAGQPESRRPRGPAFEASDTPDDTFRDGKVARRAAGLIEEYSERAEPFFLAVGFSKPHLPFVAPQKYWDLYDPAKIGLSPLTTLPQGAPSYAIPPGSELRSYHGVPEGPIPDDLALQLRHGYLACISYIDAQVGLLLDALEANGLREKTVVVVWGDHGWKLGDYGAWCKHSNVEFDTRAPLIVSAPGMSAPGQSSSALVELVDIYPTLAEVAGLPLPDHLEGSSLKPLLDRPDLPWKSAAFSQYPRVHNRVPLMGYSMRTADHRLTVWTHRGDTAKIDAVELYDLSIDPGEMTNLADHPDYAEVRERLMEQWQQGWRGALPPNA
jgi:iduronate 2-sulfatase